MSNKERQIWLQNRKHVTADQQERLQKQFPAIDISKEYRSD
jgi:hypothetical protein